MGVLPEEVHFIGGKLPGEHSLLVPFRVEASPQFVDGPRVAPDV